MCTPITSSETNQNPSQESYWAAAKILNTLGILERVISFLPSREDRMNMALTCKFWKAEIDRTPIQKIGTKLGGIPVSIIQINPTLWKWLIEILGLETTDSKWSFPTPEASQIRWRDLRKLHSVAKNALDIITRQNQNSEENSTTSQPQSPHIIKLFVIDFPGNLNLLEDKLLFPSSKQNSEVNTPSYLKNKFPHRSIVCLNTVLLGYKGSEQRSQIQEIANKANENELTFRLADPMETILPYLFHQVINPILQKKFLVKEIKRNHEDLCKEAFPLIETLNNIHEYSLKLYRQEFQLASEQCEDSLPETKGNLLDPENLKQVGILKRKTNFKLYKLLPENLKKVLTKNAWHPFLCQKQYLLPFKLRIIKDNHYFHFEFRPLKLNQASSFNHSIYTFQITFPSEALPDFKTDFGLQNLNTMHTLIAADFPYTFGLPPVQKKEARERGKKRKLED